MRMDTFLPAPGDVVGKGAADLHGRKYEQLVRKRALEGGQRLTKGPTTAATPYMAPLTLWNTGALSGGVMAAMMIR